MNLHPEPPIIVTRQPLFVNRLTYLLPILQDSRRSFLLGHQRGHFGLTHEVLLDERLALHLPKRRTLLDYVDLEPQPIARHDRFSELRAIDTGQIDHWTRRVPQ